MRGMLGFLILCELDGATDPLSGQQLAQRMATRRGTDPSPGTLYPALRRLRSSGWLTTAPSGRRNEHLHALTSAGRSAVAGARTWFQQAFGDLVRA